MSATPGPTDDELAKEVSREPVFPRYPSLVDAEHAMCVAWEKVIEWSYETDAHGWCHERPIWLTLIAALTASRETMDQQGAVLLATVADLTALRADVDSRRRPHWWRRRRRSSGAG